MNPTLFLTLVLLGAGLTGCISTEDAQPVAPNDSTDPPDATPAPEQEGRTTSGECSEASGVQNNPGAFQYSGAVACHGVQTFSWMNPAPRAFVQWSGAIAAGSLTLTIEDSLGAEVYSATFEGAGAGGSQANTEIGAPSLVEPILGPWTITLVFDEALASMGLQVVSG